MPFLVIKNFQCDVLQRGGQRMKFLCIFGRACKSWRAEIASPIWPARQPVSRLFQCVKLFFQERKFWVSVLDRLRR